jgi:hypothetical protein
MTPLIRSDNKGHHVTDVDGNVMQSLPNTRDGLKAAKSHLYKNHKTLNVSQKELVDQQAQIDQVLAEPEMESKRDKSMSKLEEMYNQKLNEVVTISTNSSSDPAIKDTVTINAQDSDAEELLDMLKMAGIERSAEPGYEPVDDVGMDISATKPLSDTESIVIDLEHMNDIEHEMTPCDINDLDSTEYAVEEGTGRAWEDGYANTEPMEKYADTDVLTNKLSGGLNRQHRQYHYGRNGDNPMSVAQLEEELENQLFNEYQAHISPMEVIEWFDNAVEVAMDISEYKLTFTDEDDSTTVPVSNIKVTYQIMQSEDDQGNSRFSEIVPVAIRVDGEDYWAEGESFFDQEIPTAMWEEIEGIIPDLVAEYSETDDPDGFANSDDYYKWKEGSRGFKTNEELNQMLKIAGMEELSERTNMRDHNSSKLGKSSRDKRPGWAKKGYSDPHQ